MSSSDLDLTRRRILAIAEDIHHLTAALYAKGIDARAAGDGEALDIVSRIERKLLAAAPKSKKPKAKAET